ncbi:MAG: PIN domain-containing protein [Chloroflexi bacterium]|nr:PIN domain-containing protein [Chloroflexota bacterium]
MMLIDTDVLIDVALRRVPHAFPAAELFEKIQHGVEAANVAWHSISNLHYLTARSLGRDNAREFILELIRFVPVAATGTEAVRYAAELPMSDFEDAMQVAAARACGATRIVTRNVSDYARSPIPAVTPQEALAGLS